MDSVSVYVEATPEDVWAVVTDVVNMGRWSPENTGGRWTGGVPGTVGATFVGHNRAGFVRWTTRCTVTVADAPREFTFEVTESATRWTYRLEPEGSGTRLTEIRDKFAVPKWYARLISKFGLLGRDRTTSMVDGMAKTLDAMKSTLESRS